MIDFDILIVGGGIAGASLGAEIAGKRTTGIIEAEEHCGYHSTGRSAAFFLESYGGPVVATLAAASHDFLAEPPDEFAQNGFLRPRGALHLSRRDWPQLPPGVNGRRVDRQELTQRIPGIKSDWVRAVFEPSCADIDVARLHAAFLRQFRNRGGRIATKAALASAEYRDGRWIVSLANGRELTCAILVNAAGAWADPVAENSGVKALGIAPKRRTMVQLRVGRSGLKDLPLINDSEGNFYFKGEADRSIWLSPHDEVDCAPCDAVPEEMDVATAVARFETVVDWPVETVERSWAGLRSFASDRLPVYGFDAANPAFFWCAGQGGFGIQTAPAAAKLAAALVLGEEPHPSVVNIEPAVFSAARFS